MGRRVKGSLHKRKRDKMMPIPFWKLLRMLHPVNVKQHTSNFNLFNEATVNSNGRMISER